jgi:hypothetical protein
MIRMDRMSLTQSPNVHPETTNLRYFRHWRPYQRPQTVPGNVQTETQDRSNLRNAEDLHDVEQAGRVNGRSDVHRERKEAYLKSDE